MNFRMNSMFMTVVFSTLCGSLASCGKSDSKKGEVTPQDSPFAGTENLPTLDLSKVKSSKCTFFEANDIKNYINMFDPHCVKKAIENGLDANGVHTDDFWKKKTSYLELALDSSATFFARSGGIDKFHPATIVALLVEAGADTNKVLTSGSTAVELAIRLPQEDVAFTQYILMHEKTNPNAASPSGFPLEVAISAGRLDALQALLGRGAKPDNTSGVGLPIFRAISASRDDMVEALLNAGANPNSKNQNGSSVLIELASGSGIQTVNLALTKGSDPLYTTASGNTPLIASLSKSGAHNLDVINRLMAVGAPTINSKLADGRSALYFAVEAGLATVANSLLDAGAETNIVYVNDGRTLGHLVTDVNVAGRLVSKGLNVNALSNVGDSPLSRALAARRLDIAKVFSAHGADIRWVSKNGNTLLHLVASDCYVEGASFLLTKGLDVDARQRDTDTTPLFAAGCQEVAKVLVDGGADLKARDNKGFHVFSALFPRAIQMAQYLAVPFVSYLTEVGVEVNADLALGFSPVHRLMERSGGVTLEMQKEILTILQRAGAKLDALDNGGRIAFQFTREIALLRHFASLGANLKVTNGSGSDLLSIVQSELRRIENDETVEIERLRRTGRADEIEAVKQQYEPRKARHRELRDYLASV